MGASVGAYWPGITEEEIDSQPGFWNDDKAWGNFMAEREDESDILEIFKRLGAGALLTYTTDGVDDSDVDWVTPAQLQIAAKALENALMNGAPGVDRILEVYGRNANKVEPIVDELLRDLADIEGLAKWVAKQGAEVMTLEVNW